MSITIRRNTGWMAKYSIIRVKLNGEKVASIQQDKQLEIETPKGKTNLKVSQFLAKSNTIEIEDGDIVEITQATFSKIAFPLIMLAAFLTGSINSFEYKMIVRAILIMFLLLPNEYNLKIMTEKTSQNP